MSLPAPNLDDLRFQRDLVDEARKRIIQYCPEWTDYNLSDPGVTLIELFAWMTELIVYRLNQVPEKNYIKFMELLGMQLRPASSARTDLTFWLSVSLPISPDNHDPVIVPHGIQVASRSTGGEEPVIFTTDQQLRIVPPRLTQLRREEDFHKNYLPRLGIETFYAFNQARPQTGDTFYLGFDEQSNISGHILRLTFENKPTEAVGVRRDDPPWVWECSLGNSAWQEIPPSLFPGEKDTTGGLNNPHGSLVLYLPRSMRPDQVYGRDAYWVRCRLEQRRPEQGMYTESPLVMGLQAATLGASVPANHAIVVENEFLDYSNGEAGQTFKLEHAPILALAEGETVEVEETHYGELEFLPWQAVNDFSKSDRYDRHYCLNTATGEISLGPGIRQPDGTVHQYGRVPETRRQLRFTHYRYGGGAIGNVPADMLQVMTTSLAYIARVNNLRRAAGGQDAESLDEVKLRARRELQAQLRAVTAEDYELLAKAASRSIARVRCNVPCSDGKLPTGVVEILVVPAAIDALRAGDLSGLYVDETLANTVVSFLDQYRLLTTTLRVREPDYLGVKVCAEIVASEFQRPEIVKARVVETLRNFINPLPLAESPEQHDELMDTTWEGWPFGRNLYLAELFSLLQRVPGVKHVLDVQIYIQPVIPSAESGPEGIPHSLAAEPMIQVVEKLLRVPQNTLLCSREHEITLAKLDGSDE